MRMRTALLLATIVAAVALPSAQESTGSIPLTTDVAFDAASIKPNNSGDSESGTNESPGGLLRATNVQLRQLIIVSYGLRNFQMPAGGPAILDARFDIVARAAAEDANKDIGTMMRQLLADRFKLAVHVETREESVYALTVARPGALGPQLTKSTRDCTPPAVRPPEGSPRACGMSGNTRTTEGSLRGTGQTMGRLATTLGNSADRLVVDRTGLDGIYDFELRYSRGELRAGAGASDLPTLFTALQEQLGLKLENARGPVEFLVIDHVEAPTPD
jgi:uncharacterized protein (TIGR03435 family)